MGKVIPAFIILHLKDQYCARVIPVISHRHADMRVTQTLLHKRQLYGHHDQLHLEIRHAKIKACNELTNRLSHFVTESVFEIPQESS